MIKSKKMNYDELSIFGYPKGDIEIVNEILRNEFSDIADIKTAYNLIIEYQSERIKRLGLFLDCKFSNENIEKVHAICQENIGEIDIYYFEDLSNRLKSIIKEKYKPFYTKKT